MNNARRQSDFGEATGLVDIDNVETVEVVRGPASVLYGSDAIGGVLNLITKVPVAGSGNNFGFSLGLRFSSADEQTKANVDVFGNSEKLSYSLGGSFRSAEDYDAAVGDFGDITLEQNDPRSTTPGSTTTASTPISATGRTTSTRFFFRAQPLPRRTRPASASSTRWRSATTAATS